MLNPLVSIIMPVHDAGKYFKPCVESILNQTLKDIEIIMVLDKPTDGTDRLAYEYARLDDRVVIIENENNFHIGLSRNRGLSVARGKYIAFSDHDDIRELNMYESLCYVAEKNDLDILFSCPSMKYGDKIVKWQLDSNVNELRTFVLADLIGFGNYYRSCPSFCFLHFNLYRKSLIEKNSIKFVDTRFITPEDVIFNLESVYYAGKIDYIASSFYYHIEYEGSTGRSLQYFNCKPRLEGMNYIYNFLIDKNIYEMYQPNFYVYVKKEVMNSIVRSNYYTCDFNGFFRNLNLFKDYSFVKESFKNHMTIGYPRNVYKNIIRFFLALYLSR